MTREQALDKIKEESDLYPEDSVDSVEWLEVYKALEQQPSDDCVSRQAVIDTVDNTIAKYIPTFIGPYEKIPLELARAIKNVSPVTPTRKKGKLIKVTETDFGIGYQCSECGRFILTESIDERKLEDFPYCHCGTDMREGINAK